MNVKELNFEEGSIILTKHGNLFKVELQAQNNSVPKVECMTTYPIDLIEKIIEIIGFDSVCDDIQRDQLYAYIQKPLEDVIFGHFEKEDFKHKRILDFGCGAGNSTVILGRLFKDCEIIGIELNSKLLELAELKKNFYTLTNIQFLTSKSGTELPDHIGTFDYIFLNAVYEHLLPNERKILIPVLGKKLNPDGSIIINETPHRWFPVETHTTEGIPFINYLPRKLVHYIVNTYSKQLKGKNLTWNELLRGGIRGGSVSEFNKILHHTNDNYELLNPTKLGMKDRIDLFDRSLADDRLSPLKRKILYHSLKVFKILTGMILTPTLAFVIRKTIQK